MRALSEHEIAAVSGGFDLSGLPPSTNVRDRGNDTLGGYIAAYGQVVGSMMWNARLAERAATMARKA